MKYFEIIFVPTNRCDKEWVHTEDVSADAAGNNFRGGTVISVSEIEEEDYEMPEHMM
jgi:hypothetical protein